MRITVRAVQAAAVAALAVLAVGCGSSGDTGRNGSGVIDQVININWGAEPPSLDPGLATDTTSGDVITNIMDPLVKLDKDLEPVPNLAKSWTVSDDGKTVTFKLRDDGRWTNGDPVTAQDFEWSWKRTISPELAADYAYQFFGIVGAAEYNACKEQLRRAPRQGRREGARRPHAAGGAHLAAAVVRAAGQPTSRSSRSIGPRSRSSAASGPTRRTSSRDGPFKLARWAHDSRLDLVKWDGWRNADQVKLQRINGSMITEGTTALRAFEAGELDTSGQGLPPVDLPRLKETPEYSQYPGLGTYYYGAQRQDRPGREAAPRDGAGDRPSDDHRQHRPGRPAPGERLHAEGHAGLRHAHGELAVAPGAR